MLNPSYKTIVDVYYDIASDVVLTVTSSTELNVIDVEGNKITGLKEGTAYVRAAYAYSPDHDSTGRHATVYTDTAKIIVKGTYQVTDKANYIVTTSSSNLNVRSGAGTKYSKIGSLAKGTVVEVVEIKDGWACLLYTSLLLRHRHGQGAGSGPAHRPLCGAPPALGPFLHGGRRPGMGEARPSLPLSLIHI